MELDLASITESCQALPREVVSMKLRINTSRPWVAQCIARRKYVLFIRGQTKHVSAKHERSIAKERLKRTETEDGMWVGSLVWGITRVDLRASKQVGLIAGYIIDHTPNIVWNI